MGKSPQRCLAAAAVVLALLSWRPAGADPGAAELWRALRAGGHVALMRHANAPGIGDPPEFRIGQCSTQRNLDEAGRAQARATGEAFRANGVARVEVRSSQWCRALETARLLDLGPVEEDPNLNSHFSDRASGPAQVTALRDYIAAIEPGSPVRVLVTHQVVIANLTGTLARPGEIVVIAPNAEGGDVLGRLGPF
jgi:phosphohistidine phosphatase SixA